ncbi:heparinase II/III family protein [Rhodococcus opacus]|uniref:Uncharacterized protein n=1 Tax=Rhodococcus opacus (strain B4) TaxID=632772 RepID=C1AY56_RHOOB|nr:alginate lyase family protein [Rhodococcus opacus]BAH54051.1 hypothetical protein ROP_58040 [Rhodococcus opacus B4]
MSPREVAWRAGQAGRSLLPIVTYYEPTDRELFGASDPHGEAALRRFREGTGGPVLLDRERAARIAIEHPHGVADVVAAADKVMDSRFGFFSYAEVNLGRPIDWHYDPIARVRWPAVSAGRINHRTFAGDPKWIWELNRLQHLPWLAEAWLFTGDRKYSSAAFVQLDSWIAQNPPGIGIAWRGAFEAGVRAVSIVVALQGLRDSPDLTAERFRDIVRVLAQSAKRCWQYRSRYSSANNHLVGELAGLAISAIAFPDVAPLARWEATALRALALEATRQILPDGAGAEQAVGYQIFTAELLLTVVSSVALRGGRPPSAIVDALDRSALFLAALVGDGDPAPRYGDDDEGFAVRLGAEPVRTVRDHLGAVAAVTGNVIARNAGRATLSSAWLRTANPVGPTTRPRFDGTASFIAPDGGLAVLRAHQRRLTMDIGPLGYLSPAAHGHADALAVTLSVGGEELVGDPGTASYYGHPDWRTAHRGSRAHATVCIDGLDQSVIGGPFLWSRHARVRMRSIDLSKGIVDAEHDGYVRLPDPVVHRRCLIAPPTRHAILVVDLITGLGSHEMCTSWPLPPELDVSATGSEHLVSRGGTPVLQILYAGTGELERDEVRGGTLLGWWSRRLESREPSWLVGAHCVGEVPAVIVSALNPLCGRDERISNLRVTLDERRIVARWRESDAEVVVEVDA